MGLKGVHSVVRHFLQIVLNDNVVFVNLDRSLLLVDEHMRSRPDSINKQQLYAGKATHSTWFSARLEHEYKRAGALHLFAAFDTRTGKVYARTEMRKRQVAFYLLGSNKAAHLQLRLNKHNGAT